MARVLTSIKRQFDEKADLPICGLTITAKPDQIAGMPIEPDDYRTPGQLIQALLDERGWTKRVLAVVLDVDETGLNKIIAGGRPIDAKTALALSELFDVPAERFLNLQLTFDLAHARIVTRPDPGRMTRAFLFGHLPIAEMIKRGWLDADDVRDITKVMSALTKFFKADDPDQIEILPHAAKKTEVSGEVSPAQLAYLYRAKEIAREMLVSRYSRKSLLAAIEQLRVLLTSPDAVRKVPRILAECGVRFVIIEALSGTKMDGVCFWLDDDSPVIAMSVRFDRIDNFWFVLRHELEHVLREHGRSAPVIDADLEGERAGVSGNIAEEERQANEAAADFCVPQKKLDGFIARKAPFFNERDVVGFARTLNVHPGIVAGQLRHRTGRFELFAKHLVKIRSSVLPSAMVDGWGDIAPVGH